MTSCLLGPCDGRRRTHCCCGCPDEDRVLCQGNKCPKVEMNRDIDCPHKVVVH